MFVIPRDSRFYADPRNQCPSGGVHEWRPIVTWRTDLALGQGMWMCEKCRIQQVGNLDDPPEIRYLGPMGL